MAAFRPGTTVPLLGTAFDQGVYQHRVDQINKFYNPDANIDFEGSGMSIGFISDSIGDHHDRREQFRPAWRWQ